MKAAVADAESTEGNVKPKPETYYHHIKRNAIIGRRPVHAGHLILQISSV